MAPSRIMTLSDGTPILLRPVIPSDREGLARGVREMSRSSRYMRFLAGVTELTESQLDYFTQIDQDRHVAWCAVEPEPGRRAYGLGRFICEENNIASFALAVIDDMQGRGLGTLLLAQLSLEALRRGVVQLKSEVLMENPIIPNWFPKLGGWIDYNQKLAISEVHLPILPDLRSASGARLKAWMDRLLEE
jgi:GNAT superfamily N-acetyltransferase